MGSKGKDFLERVQVTSRAQWRDWLQANHTQAESIWLITYKKHMGELYLPYGDIVEEALCFGWIDSLPRALDEERRMLLVSPRRRRSVWSELNRTRVQRLIQTGLMMPPGMAKIEQAKLDGSWSMLQNLEKIPADLAAALAANHRAASNFRAASPFAKKGFLAWIRSAKTEETRIRRIRETVRLVARNRRPDESPLKPKARSRKKN